jgi:hypothetical protein
LSLSNIVKRGILSVVSYVREKITLTYEKLSRIKSFEDGGLVPLPDVVKSYNTPQPCITIYFMNNTDISFWVLNAKYDNFLAWISSNTADQPCFNFDCGSRTIGVVRDKIVRYEVTGVSDLHLKSLYRSL